MGTGGGDSMFITDMMNVDAEDKPNNTQELFMLEDYNQRIANSIIMIIITIVGIVGNTLVIVAVILSRKLQSSTNWFIVNLALADFLTCLMLPFNVVAMLSRSGWPLPNWICATSAAVFFICLGASVMTLALIAYNRWYLLTQPIVKFMKLYKPPKVFLMLLAAWMYPSLLVLVPYFAGLGILGYSKEYKTCSQDTSLPTSDIYSLTAGACVIFPIFIIIVAIYIRIYIFVSRQSSAMAKTRRNEGITLESSSSKISSTKTTNTSDTPEQAGPNVETVLEYTIKSSENGANDVAPGNLSKSKHQPRWSVKSFNPRASNPSIRKSDEGKSQRRVNKYHVTVTKRLAIVVLAFFLCMLPFGINVVLPGSADMAVPWTALLTTVNSCINPLIYARTMPEFRKVMWAIIRCRFQEIPEPLACIRRQRF
ncbi:5-hydroxytryptamine receptor 1F-like [Lytechinus pictus]|uniref:5-hydroxytryptamine receptor 1F-like n=1 Tax=Lytechinus pictus TaxID=7653 RepID=UPI0030B9B558